MFSAGAPSASPTASPSIPPRARSRRSPPGGLPPPVGAVRGTVRSRGRGGPAGGSGGEEAGSALMVRAVLCSRAGVSALVAGQDAVALVDELAAQRAQADLAAVVLLEGRCGDLVLPLGIAADPAPVRRAGPRRSRRPCSSRTSRCSAPGRAAPAAGGQQPVALGERAMWSGRVKKEMNAMAAFLCRVSWRDGQGLRAGALSVARPGVARRARQRDPLEALGACSTTCWRKEKPSGTHRVLARRRSRAAGRSRPCRARRASADLSLWSWPWMRWRTCFSALRADLDVVLPSAAGRRCRRSSATGSAPC